MQIIYKKTSELIPYINNPRNNANAVDAVASSIKNYGFKNPIIIDKDNEIVAGHTRLLAAKKLGLEEVPCVVADDLTPAQIKAFRIADNKVAEASEWNLEMLAVEIQDLEGFTGFDAAELEDLFPKDENEIIEDEAPEPPEKPISKLGDLWLIGRHRLVCGDSTEPNTYVVLMDDMKANLVVTDLPYNVNYEGKAGKIKNDNMGKKEFYEFLLKAFKNMFEAMEDGAAIYVFHADKEAVNFRNSFQDAGLFYHETCTWVKNSLVLGHSDYQYATEPILYGWKATAPHKYYGGRAQSTKWCFDRPTKSPLHPTTKPINLIAYPIKNSSLSNCIVLDPFGGSGSTLIACEQTNRICYTVELDEKYADVIVQRYINHLESDENVFLVRDGVKTKYTDIKKE